MRRPTRTRRLSITTVVSVIVILMVAGAIDCAASDPELFFRDPHQSELLAKYKGSIVLEDENPRRTQLLASDGRKITILSLDTLKPVAGTAQIATPTAIQKAAFRPDGKQIVALTSDGAIYAWDVASGKLSFPSFHLSGKTFRSVTYSPNSKIFLTVTDAGICRWSAENGKPMPPAINTFDSAGGGFLSAEFSGMGRYFFAIDSRPSQVPVWDSETAIPIHYFRPTERAAIINCVTFSRDGQRIALGVRGDDKVGGLWVYDLASGALRFHSPTASGDPSALTFSNNDGAIAVDSTVNLEVFDASTGRRLQVTGGCSARSLKFSPNDKMLLAVGDGARVLDSHRVKNVVLDFALGPRVVAAYFGANSKLLAVTYQGGTTMVWRIPMEDN